MSGPPMPAVVEVRSTDAGPVAVINGGDPIPLHPGIEIVVVPAGETGGQRFVTFALAVDQLVVGNARPSVATPEGRASRIWGARPSDPRVSLRGGAADV